MVDIFKECRERVTAEQAAIAYGCTPNRNGWVCCPLHGEKTPSLKFYRKNGTFYCFGCHKGGTAIDFIRELCGLDALGAVRELNRAFSLNLPINRQQTPAERREAEQAAQRRREVADTRAAFETWREQTIRRLNKCFLIAHLLDKPPDDMTETEAQAVIWQPAMEFWADCLMFGSLEEQMQIFRDRRAIEARCRMILNDMPQKSSAA